MSRLSVPVVHAFTDGGWGGNPAGVVLDAERFSAPDRQGIAAAAGLSETAFVSAPTGGDGFHVDFFTPTRQVPDCGHATVAAFSLLAQQGRISGGRSVKELADGTRRTIDLVGDRVFMAQAPARYTPLAAGGDGAPAVALSSVLASLGLTPDDLLPGAAPLIAHNGVNGLLVPVRDAATLARLVPDLSAVHAVSDALDLVMYYVFSLQAQAPGRDAGARMFASRFGIPEESATGMAAGLLACCLHDHLGVRKTRLVIEQGRFMTPPAPCELLAEMTLDGPTITGLRVGGSARVGGSVEVEWQQPSLPC